MNVMVFEACNETNPNFFLLGLIYYVMWNRMYHAMLVKTGSESTTWTLSLLSGDGRWCKLLLFPSVL